MDIQSGYYEAGIVLFWLLFAYLFMDKFLFRGQLGEICFGKARRRMAKTLRSIAGWFDPVKEEQKKGRRRTKGKTEKKEVPVVSESEKRNIPTAKAEMKDDEKVEAKKKAETIVADAKAEAKSVQEASEKEIGILKESAAISAEQAKRDAMLAFKTEVQAEFEKILSAKIENNLSDAALGKLIHAVVSDEDVKNYAVEVSEVNDSLKAELAEEIKNGLEIRPTKGVRAGFRLAAKDGSGYFDCSDDEIMQMLMPYFRDLDF